MVKGVAGCEELSVSSLLFFLTQARPLNPSVTKSSLLRLRMLADKAMKRIDDTP